MSKLKVGQKYTWVNPYTQECLIAEIIEPTDERLRHKPVSSNDICVWFPEINTANTYYADTAIECLKELK